MSRARSVGVEGRLCGDGRVLGRSRDAAAKLEAMRRTQVGRRAPGGRADILVRRRNAAWRTARTADKGRRWARERHEREVVGRS